MPQVEKTLSAKDAYELYVKNFPLKLTVADKFINDHLVAAPNLSKKISIEAAIERYKKNQKITCSSWMLMDKSSVISKATTAQKRARIYNGTQQLCANIKVTRRTVTIQRLTPKEAHQYKHQDVTIGKETHMLNCVSDEDQVTINVVGDWRPLTGEFELYHYEEDALPTDHAMLSEYLKWIFDTDSKTYIRPVAKK